MQPLTLALAQTHPRLGGIAHNVAVAAGTVTDLGRTGVDFCLFPELSLTGYDMGILGNPRVWLGPGDQRLEPLRSACQATGATAVVSAPYLTEDGQRWIAAITVTPDGSEVTVGKRYLHGQETRHFDPDSRPVSCLSVKGWQIALAVCYDAAVPTHAAEAAAAGADVYAVACLYTSEQRRRMDVHMAARAMDHGMFALAANLAGAGVGWTSCGESGIWSPDGARGDHLGATTGVLTAVLDHRP